MAQQSINAKDDVGSDTGNSSNLRGIEVDVNDQSNESKKNYSDEPPREKITYRA